MDFDKNRNLLKMEWDKSKDEDRALDIIIDVAMLLGHLRTYAKTWNTQNTQGTDYGYTISFVEEPDRAIEQLKNMARGHALSQGRNYITMEDIPIVIKTALSTASIERTTIFDLLLAHNGTLTTSLIEESLNLHEHVAHRTMQELKVVGLVDLDKGNKSNSAFVISLRSEFDWFLSDEFRKLREDFQPADYSEYLKKDTEKDEKVASRKNTPELMSSSSSSSSSGGIYDIDNHDKGTGRRGGISASKNLMYECPRCPFQDPDPSKITDHRIQSHEQDRELRE
jgi:hypothetical protein